MSLISDLRESWSEQYQLPCVSVENPDFANPDSVIGMCESIGAVRRVDGIEFCAELRGDIGPELWTEESLRRSVGKQLPEAESPRRHTPKEIDELFADLRNLDVPRDESAFDKLKCEAQHGRRIGWYYKADEEYHREWQGDDPRESPPYSGLMVCMPGKEMRGGADTDLDHDECIVVVERFPTEKCYPDAAWIALGRLLDADDLVEVFPVNNDE